MFSIRRMCILGLLICQILHVSLQMRREHWREISRWHDPVEMFTDNRLDAGEDNCSGSDEKCQMRARAAAVKERQLRVLITGQNDDVYEDAAIKRVAAKQPRISEDSTLLPINLNNMDVSKYFKSSQLLACSCEARHELTDLGNAYYPRYVSSAVCMPGVCPNTPFHCRPKHYKMYFLKRRDENVDDTDGQTPTPPEILRKDWVFEALPIPVTCECGP